MSLSSKSKFLSYVLRHRPDEFGLTLSDGGWVSIDKLLEAINKGNQKITREELAHIEKTIRLIKQAEDIVGLYDSKEAVDILRQAIVVNLNTMSIMMEKGFISKSEAATEAYLRKRANLTKLYDVLGSLEFMPIPESIDQEEIKEPVTVLKW